MNIKNFNRYLKQLSKILYKKNKLKGGFEMPRLRQGASYFLLVLSIIIMIYLVYIFIRYLYHKEYSQSNNCMGYKGCLLLSEVKNGKKPYSLGIHSIPKSLKGMGYSLGIWLYVKSDNFNTRVQKFRNILTRGNTKSYQNFKDTQYSVQPGVWLYGNTNKILIRWETQGRIRNIVSCKNTRTPCEPRTRCRDNNDEVKYCVNKNGKTQFEKEDTSIHSMNPYINPPNKLCSGVKTGEDTLWNTSDTNTDNEICIDNIPLDRWFQLFIVLHTQTLDIYIDGKIYTTFTLNSLPKIIEDAEVKLSTDNSPFYQNLNGFSGALTQLRYFNYPLSPYDVLRVYSWGPNPLNNEKTTQEENHKKNQEKKKSHSHHQSHQLGSDNY